MQLGPGVAALVVQMHVEVGVPLARLAKLLRTTFGLQVTPGGLVHLLHRVARGAAPLYGLLREQVRNSPVVVPDETGWRVGAVRHWLWVFATPQDVSAALGRLGLEGDDDTSRCGAEERPRRDAPFSRELARAREGSRSALDVLFARYGGWLRRCVRGRLPSWARGAVDTSDLVQDTLLHTFARLGGFKSKQSRRCGSTCGASARTGSGTSCGR